MAAFFLDPELIGGIDIVRGPTANIYGSGAIGGVASFRTKDIEDVVRPGERWGIDVTAAWADRTRLAAWRRRFGGIRLNPDVRPVRRRSFYRNNSNYKDGSGTDRRATRQSCRQCDRASSPRARWDGHQIKFGGVFQEFDYSIGQPNRGPTTPSAPAARSPARRSTIRPCSNYMGTAELALQQARRRSVRLERELLRQSHRERPDQDLQQPHHHRRRALHAGLARQQHLRLCRRLARLSARYDRHRCLQHVALRSTATGAMRSPTAVDAFRDDVATFDVSGNSNITTPGGERTVSGAFVQIKSNYSTWLEVIGAARYDRYRADSSAGVSTRATGSRRRSRSA